LAWLLLATAAGAAGLTSRLHPPLPQIVLLGLTTGLLLASRLAPRFSSFIASLDWSAFVALHATRFVGLYFLRACGGGDLPREFAVPAAIGDTAVAALAVLLVVFGRWITRRPGIVLAWNLLGLADILLVVAKAARLSLADPPSMAALLRLPLSLLPTFLVPIIVASHVLLLVRLRRWSEAH